MTNINNLAISADAVDENDKINDLTRQPPRNEEVEAALLGAILRNNRAYEQISDILRAEHFFAIEHQKIYALVKKLIDAGQEARSTTLQHLIVGDEMLQSLGGSNYLRDLAANVINVINAKNYANIIYDLYLKRELIGLGEDVVNDAYDHDIDETADIQIQKVESRLYQLATTGEVDRGVTSLGDAATMAMAATEEAFRRDNHVVGVTTGIRDIDNMLGGLHRSDLLILAGRPAMGKTALATSIAFNAAKAYKIITDDADNEITEGAKVLFFSLEMSAEQLAGRILSGEAKISSDKMRRGEINQGDFNRVAVAAQELSRIPLYIDDTPALTITGLRQRARRLQRQHGLHLIIIDYLQLLSGPPDKRMDNRVQEVSEITRGLKTLAKELDIPVLALSQLSRQVESREDKRPMLSDLRESGSIEQDADVVSFVYRAEYYLQREHPEQRAGEDDAKFHEREARQNQRVSEARNIAEFIIAKQRHGPVGTVEMHFDGEYAKFSDLDKHHQE